MNKRQFILNFLDDRGPKGAYTYEIFKSWEEMAAKYQGKPIGNYQNFRISVGLLKKEGLIEPFRQEASKHGWAKTYYRLRGRAFL